MYIYIHSPIHTSICGQRYTSTSIHTYIFILTLLYIQHRRRGTYEYVQTLDMYMYIYMYQCIYIHIYIYKHTYIYTQIYIHTWTYVYNHSHPHIYIHVYYYSNNTDITVVIYSSQLSTEYIPSTTDFSDASFEDWKRASSSWSTVLARVFENRASICRYCLPITAALRSAIVYILILRVQLFFLDPIHAAVACLWFFFSGFFVCIGFLLKCRQSSGGCLWWLCVVCEQSVCRSWELSFGYWCCVILSFGYWRSGASRAYTAVLQCKDTYLYVYESTYARMHVYSQVKTYAYMYTYLYIYMNIHVNVCIYMHKKVNQCVYMY